MKDHEDKKQKIIKKGFEIMHLKGYNATGVKDIVDAAGIPKGSFYNYFESKEDFVIQALQYSADHCNTVMGETLKDRSLPPLQRIEKYYKESIKYFRERDFTLGCFGGNLCIEMGDISLPIGSATEAFFKRLESVLLSCLQEAQDAGDLAKEKNIDKLAKFIYNSWNGAVLRMKASRSPEPLNIFREMLTEVLFR
ncbi:TetR family transcriptional regulator C-terminal domain-containing protein [candidate division KSB1 bacterium]|nr:TetR family transcriptional regulator C-terminal domain-containing protein [candidate division KSB1 bacterium]